MTSLKIQHFSLPEAVTFLILDLAKLCYILKDASTERTRDVRQHMKGSKNDYATFTGAIPASGSGSLVKQILVGLVLGILLAWIQNPRRKLLVC